MSSPRSTKDFWFRTNKLHPDVLVLLIVSKLLAKDFTWIHNQVNAGKTSLWEMTRAAFSKCYGLGDKFSAKQLIFAAIQSTGEDCADIMFRKLDLIDECKYLTNETDRCEVFVESLLPDVKKHFSDRTFTSVDNLETPFKQWPERWINGSRS